MAKAINWFPDSCDCAFKNQPKADNSDMELVRVLRVCSLHGHIVDAQELYQTVRDECRMRNDVTAGILDNVSGIADNKTDRIGATIKELKPGKDVLWSFDKDRNLIIESIGFTQVEKDRLSQYINSRGDNSRVRII